jgi:hypothetical protein
MMFEDAMAQEGEWLGFLVFPWVFNLVFWFYHVNCCGNDDLWSRSWLRVYGARKSPSCGLIQRETEIGAGSDWSLDIAT